MQLITVKYLISSGLLVAAIDDLALPEVLTDQHAARGDGSTLVTVHPGMKSHRVRRDAMAPCRPGSLEPQEDNGRDRLFQAGKSCRDNPSRPTHRVHGGGRIIVAGRPDHEPTSRPDEELESEKSVMTPAQESNHDGGGHSQSSDS